MLGGPGVFTVDDFSRIAVKVVRLDWLQNPGYTAT